MDGPPPLVHRPGHGGRSEQCSDDLYRPAATGDCSRRTIHLARIIVALCLRALPDEGMMMKVYIDTNDWWIGYYRGSNYHFVCPLPTVVIRWDRRSK